MEQILIALLYIVIVAVLYQILLEKTAKDDITPLIATGFIVGCCILLGGVLCRIFYSPEYMDVYGMLAVIIVSGFCLDKFNTYLKREYEDKE